MSLIQPLQPVANVRFIDVKPGSEVRYTHATGQKPPFTARVLQVDPEWGAASIPAHVFLREGSTEAEMMPADGTWRVEVLLDSSVLAAGADPANVIHAVRRAVEVEAIQFKGGFDSASEVIQFAGGKANTNWRAASADGPEAIVITKADGAQYITPGDYAVIENDTVDVYDATRFGNTFDVD
jgi:hypothetical protein